MVFQYSTDIQQTLKSGLEGYPQSKIYQISNNHWQTMRKCIWKINSTRVVEYCTTTLPPINYLHPTLGKFQEK